MKKIIALILLLLLILLTMVSCDPPQDIFNNYYLKNSVEKFMDVQVFPKVTDTTKNESISYSYSLNTASQDFNEGIFYCDNCKSTDDLTHDLDLSAITNNQRALVYLEIKVVDHGYDYYRNQYDDEHGQIYFRERGANTQWISAQPIFNESVTGIFVLTDEQGHIEFYHDHNSPYWANPTCEPGYEIYKWEQIVITCKWMSQGITIK